MKKRKLKYRPDLSALTLDFGPFSQPNKLPSPGIFQRIKSEMLKKKERADLRQKPFEYTRLELSLQQKLKQKAFNKEEQRTQLVMLQKCQNYFHLRKSKCVETPGRARTPKLGKRQNLVRPKTSMGMSQHRSAASSFVTQLQGVMDDCDKEETQIKENMGLFTFYCKMMDRRLGGITNSIQKKQRMI